jgi:hypothetical protein
VAAARTQTIGLQPFDGLTLQQHARLAPKTIGSKVFLQNAHVDVLSIAGIVTIKTGNGRKSSQPNG